MQSYAGAAVLTLTETNKAFFWHTLLYTKGLTWFYIIFWPTGLLTFLWLSSWIIVYQPENSFSLEVFFLYSLHHPQSTK